MAWWDHEELKSPADRSDKYITAFPGEYSAKEVAAAQRRVDAEKGEIIMTGSRDLITTVALSDGTEVKVYMPTLGDVEDLFSGKLGGENFAFYMASKATGLSIQEIRDLPLHDGMVILGVINPALASMTQYLTGQTYEQD